jgi:hypothetical protein
LVRVSEAGYSASSLVLLKIGIAVMAVVVAGSSSPSVG